eukprot:CAMPEP_0204092016 /NCGR_PEP_ID=MMETSP0360-20130528/189695_1 /ASSEMBLY_ACC=CAM_ASM_000342 /TAXON_ID=268821 /ORGANISM="Scrippsiella Hangoei, Strain SHTV-5" /LENGTH=311 /DNA_ID=CAMNT_0051041285 /DNA_START=70 /DNA_END=1006 /DNA_ORIENTATION=-
MAFRSGSLLVLGLLLGQASAGTNEVGKKFLEENTKMPGVITLPSGLQYKVLTEGTGEDHPTKDSPCECHYAGTTPSLTPDAVDKDEADWAEFDSSYKRGDPTTFAPNQVIAGWTEAMQLMVEGDKWDEGTGEDHPTKDSPCECHYAGTTPSLTPDAVDKDEADWAEFDSSYKRGDPTTFAPNQVIAGWTEAMQLMVEGDKWEMYIPSDLGYGDGGSPPKIMGGDVLIFRMEILKIKGSKAPADKCDPDTTKGCNDKQKGYVEKQGTATADKRKAELKRLEGMQGGEMKPENRNWLSSRIKLLKKMVKKDEL